MVKLRQIGHDSPVAINGSLFIDVKLRSLVNGNLKQTTEGYIRSWHEFIYGIKRDAGKGSQIKTAVKNATERRRRIFFFFSSA